MGLRNLGLATLEPRPLAEGDIAPGGELVAICSISSGLMRARFKRVGLIAVERFPVAGVGVGLIDVGLVALAIVAVGLNAVSRAIGLCGMVRVVPSGTSGSFTESVD